MKFTIEKNKFLNLIKIPSNIIDNTNINPILTGLLIECVNNKIQIIASNNSLSVLNFLDEIKIEKEGRVLLRGKLLYNIISKIKDSQINFEIIDSSVLRIKTPNFTSDLNLLDTTAYPMINFNFENWEKIEIDGNFLHSVVNKLINTTNVVLDRATPLNGILFDSTRVEGILESIGTDGHHLSYLKIPFHGPKFKFVIGVDNLKNIAELVDAKHNIVFFYKNEKLIIKINDTLFNCRLLVGDFPSAIKAIESLQTHKFTMNKQEFINAIERGVILANSEKKPSVLLNINKDKMQINCRSIEFGSSFEEININNNSGEPISVSFNVKYLLDLLKNIDNSVVTVEYTDVNKPFFIKNETNPNYTSLVLPIRII